jgi:Domain of unknown function (DUF4390)
VTAFFTDCCKSDSARRLISGTGAWYLSALQKSIATLLLVSALSIAAAAGLSVSSAAVAPNNDGYFLDADFNLRLNSTLEDALSRGVVLYFVIEGRLWRPRWWWFNDTVSVVQESRKLSYNSLTRQYRLSTGRQYENFSALDDAETALSQVRNWKISDLQSLGKSNRYGGSVRMWLDVTQLPKPFQVKAVTATEWKLDSDEFVFDVNL